MHFGTLSVTSGIVEPVTSGASLDFKHPVLRLCHSLLVKGSSAGKRREQRRECKMLYLGCTRDQAVSKDCGFLHCWGGNCTKKLSCIYALCSLKSPLTVGENKLLSVRETGLNWDAYNTELDCSSLPVIHLISSLTKDVVYDFWQWGDILFKPTSAVL